MSSPSRHSPRVLALLAATPLALAAQVRPFVFSQVAGAEVGAPRVVAFGDVAYGHNMFAALGPERLEQRAGAQVRLADRVHLVAQGGWTTAQDAATSRAMAQAEVLADVLSPASRAFLSVGVGGMRDYRATGVALGRLVTGYRWSRTTLVGNLRLEKAFARAGAEPRDAVDLATTLGVSHELTPYIRVGAESVIEDLEGLVEQEEAEGGAKLMAGPSVRIGLPRSRWGATVIAGPVLRLSNSTVSGGASGAPRELGSARGYVVRTSIAYRW